MFVDNEAVIKYNEFNEMVRCFMRLKRFIIAFVLICVLLCTVGCTGIEAGNELISNITNSTKLTVPDFRGLSYDEIAANSEYADFQLVVQYEVNDTVPKGVVIAQGIDAGKKIARDRSIMLYVSSGPALVEVPRIDGMGIQDARLILTKYGIKYREVPQASESVAKNIVIVTNPSAGEKIEPDVTVDVYVSVGPEVTYSKVGDYEGMTEDEAKEAIANDGFTLGEVTYVDSEKTAGTVVSQSIEKGKTTQTGSVINISVSTGTPLYQYKLDFKDELLVLIFDDEHKDMTLSLVMDGEVIETTDEFDVNVRSGEFEFNVTAKTKTATAIVRINFINGESVDAFIYDIDFMSETHKLTKNNDLYDYVVGVDKESLSR